MNDIQRGVLNLIKSAITDQAMPLPDGFSMDEVYPLAKAHQLIPIVYAGAVRCGISNRTPIMRQMLQVYCQCTFYSEAQMEIVSRLYEAFEQEGIDYMPLKGCNMKKLYPKPEYRQMGDADILIRVEQYDKIRPIVKSLGLEEQPANHHELPWHSERLHLELHRQLVPTHNKDFYSYFGDGWQLAEKRCGYRYAMSAENEFIYLFSHFAKHYRGGGVGCRQVVDLWVYRCANPGLDENYIRGEMQKLHMQEFYDNMCDLLRFWFEDGKASDKTEFISLHIFNSGSWGSQEKQILATALKGVRSTGSVKAGKRQSVLQAVFPPASILETRYTVLRKAPWLLPVIWPVRWVDVLLFRRGALHKRKAILNYATEERLTSFQEALNYVGLDYNWGNDD